MPTISFRDPGGFVLQTDSQVFRVVRGEEAAVLSVFLRSKCGRELIDGGEFISSHEAAPSDRQRVLGAVGDRAQRWPDATVLEHQKIWFASFPYEWPRAMLREAARVTLDVSTRLLASGYGLKDATPYNVLFRGADAIFVDALSIEKRDPADPIWRPMGQFLQTFLYPLLLEQATQVPAHETMFGRREGLTPEDLYRRLSWAQRLQPANLRWASLPKWLSGKSRPAEASTYRARRIDPGAARHMLGSTYRSLQRAIESIPVTQDTRSTWSDYAIHCHYEPGSRDAKRSFVSQVLTDLGPGRVLDLGANDGEYSRLAASAGHEVVACDIDATAANRLWLRSKEENLAILPLVCNIANPSPGMGWGNSEQKPLLQRAQGYFDCVLMLALLHHLTVTERVPLPMVLDMASQMSRGSVVIEWVSPQDPFYQALVRGREELHRHDTLEAFEQQCQRRFRVVRKTSLMEGRRWLFHLAKT